MTIAINLWHTVEHTAEELHAKETAILADIEELVTKHGVSGSFAGTEINAALSPVAKVVEDAAEAVAGPVGEEVATGAVDVVEHVVDAEADKVEEAAASQVEAVATDVATAAEGATEATPEAPAEGPAEGTATPA